MSRRKIKKDSRTGGVTAQTPWVQPGGDRQNEEEKREVAGRSGVVAVICCLLVWLVLVVYWQTSEFGFVNYDDDFILYKNKHMLQGLTWENVEWSMTAGIGKEAQDDDYWRPLSLMSHMLDVSMFGLKAGAHHLMSVALHGLTAVALFLVMRGMTAALWRPAFVAALFAVHPLHVESVAWVAERKDVLSGLFFVLALGAYHRHSQGSFRWGSYLLMLLLSAFSMMSKPMLVTLPCALLLMDVWPLNRLGTVPLKRIVMEKIPLLGMSIFVAVLTLGGHGSTNDVLWAKLPWFYQAGNALLSYGIYIKQTLWPVRLSCFYPYPGIGYFDQNIKVGLDFGQVALACLVLTFITAIVWWQRKKTCLVVGWLWYLGMLVPVIGLFVQQGDQAHADRYTYLAMTGLGLMVAWPAGEWAKKNQVRKNLAGGVAVMLTVLLAFTAKAQARYWRDSVSLWSRVVECNPDDYASHYGLGNALVLAGRMDEATASYRNALKIYPLFPRGNLVVGINLLLAGRLKEAQDHFEKVLQVEPQTAQAHSGLAYVFLCKGELAAAVSHYKTAVGIEPTAANYCGLGNAQLQSGETAKAIESYLLAITTDPGHLDAKFGMGTAYDRLGRTEIAAKHYSEILEKNPQHLPTLNNYAWMLATSRQDSVRNGAQAMVLVEHALELSGGSKLHLLHTLAAAYAETGQYDKAVQTAQQVESMAKTEGNAALMKQCQREEAVYATGAPWRE